MNKRRKRGKFSDEEKAFIDAYLSTHKIKEAAKMAGRGLKWAYARMDEERIINEIDKRQAENAEKANINNEWILKQVKAVVEKAQKDASWSAALKGLEMLGKVTGLFDNAQSDGVSYNIMGNVIVAKDAETAQKLIENPQSKDLEGEYEILTFDIGEGA